MAHDQTQGTARRIVRALDLGPEAAAAAGADATLGAPDLNGDRASTGGNGPRLDFSSVLEGKRSRALVGRTDPGLAREVGTATGPVGQISVCAPGIDVARIGGARIVVVAAHRAAGADAARASVATGAGVAVAAVDRLRCIDAALGDVAAVQGADIVVIANDGAARALARRAGVAAGARVLVIAIARYCWENTAQSRVAGVQGANVAIGAVDRRAHAEAGLAHVAAGAGVAVGARRCVGQVTATGLGVT